MHISSFVKISVYLLLLILTIHYTVLHGISTIAVYTTLNLGFYISFIVLISFVVSVCLFFGGVFGFGLCFVFLVFVFLILNFINSKRQCNHAIKIHGHISRRVVKIDQYMTLNKLHKLQR